MRTFKTLFLIVFPLWATAQNTDNVFSMEEAIAYALEHNASAINASRDVTDAQKQKWEVIADGLPQISGSINYQNQLRQPQTQFPSILVPEQFLPAGVVQDPNNFVTIVFGQPQQLTGTATLTQQLFDGSYIVGVQATKAFLDFTENNKEKTQGDIRKAVVEAYGNVLLAKESVVILENNKTTLEKNVFETQRIFETGLGDEESVDQLKITLASVNSQLKNALRLETLTLQFLNAVMGMNLDNPTILEQNLDGLAQQQIDLALADSKLDIANNVDYKMALNLNEQRYFELKLAKSRALPTLNAFVNYSGFSFGESFGQFFDNGQDYFTSSILGVDLSIPIFSSLKRSASTQRAKIAYEKAKTQLSDAEKQIRLQLDQARSRYILGIEQYNTAQENLALAERIEKKNQIKYSEGLASSFELRQAQLQLYSAQQEYLQSMIELINSKADLEIILNQ